MKWAVRRCVCGLNPCTRKIPGTAAFCCAGSCYAITDEADSLLIDESRTPLIISGPVVGREEVNFMRAVMDFAERLENGKDFTIDSSTRQIKIKESRRTERSSNSSCRPIRNGPVPSVRTR